MPTQEELESYAVLAGGGLLVVGLLLFIKSSPPRSFYYDGSLCPAQEVMQWLQRKLNEGKITANDVDRLLYTSITLRDWVDSVMSSRGFDMTDLYELLRICRYSLSAVGSGRLARSSAPDFSPCPCPPFCP